MNTTIPLPLALNFAAWTVLAVFAGFAGLLQLLDLSHGANLIRAPLLLGISGFSFGYVGGTFLGRKEAPVLGFLAQVGAIAVGAGYYLRAGNPFGWVLVALGLWGIVTLVAYRRTVLA